MEVVDTHIHEEDQKCTKIVQNHIVERLDSNTTEKSRLNSNITEKSEFDLEMMEDDDFHIRFDENAIVLIRSKLDSVEIDIVE